MDRNYRCFVCVFRHHHHSRVIRVVWCCQVFLDSVVPLFLFSLIFIHNFFSLSNSVHYILVCLWSIGKWVKFSLDIQKNNLCSVHNMMMYCVFDVCVCVFIFKVVKSSSIYSIIFSSSVNLVYFSKNISCLSYSTFDGSSFQIVFSFIHLICLCY